MNNLVRNKRAVVLILTVVLVMSMMSVAFADGISPGKKIGSWVQGEAAGFLTAIMACIGIWLLIKRQLMGAITLLFFAGLAALFVFDGTALAQKLMATVNGWL